MTPARHIANLSIERAAVARAQLRGNEAPDPLVERTERETGRMLTLRAGLLSATTNERGE